MKSFFVIAHPVFRCSGCGHLSAKGGSFDTCNNCRKNYGVEWVPIEGRLVANDTDAIGHILELAGADAERFRPSPEDETELRYWLKGYKAFREAVMRLLELDGGER